MKPSGNTVLITGGSAGIGLALAEKFLDYSNQVIIASRNTERLAQVKLKLPGVHTYVCDIGKAPEREKLYQWISTEHPSLNVLVNNAGIQYQFRIDQEEDPLPRIEQEIRVNLLGPVSLCRQFLPLLKEKEQAAIVNVSSVLAFAPKESAPVYCATKSALRSFTQALRYQLEETPIQVMELIPPLVDTHMTEGRWEGFTPTQLASEFWPAFLKAKPDIFVGKAKKIPLAMRLIPGRAHRLMRGKKKKSGGI